MKPANASLFMALMLVGCVTTEGGSRKLPASVTADVRAFALTGNYLAASWDSQVAIWDIESGKLVRKWTPPEPGTAVGGVWASPSQPAVFAVALGGTDQSGPTFVFIGADGNYPALVAEPRRRNVECVLGFTANGKEFVYATSGLKLIFLDPQTGRITRTVDIGVADDMRREAWQGMRITPDGSAYVLCLGTKLVARDLAGKELWRIDSTKPGTANQCLPRSGVGPAICMEDAATLSVLDTATGKPLGQLSPVKMMEIATVSLDGSAIAVVSQDRLSILSPLTKDKAPIPLSPAIHLQCQFSDDSKLLLGMPVLKPKAYDAKTNTETMARDSSTFYVYDVTSGKLLRQFAIHRPE